MNIIKKIHYILIVIMMFILVIWPYKIEYHISLCTLLLINNIIIFSKEKQKYKIDIFDIIPLLLPLTNVLILLLKLNVDSLINNIINIYIELCIITTAIIFRRNINKDENIPLLLEIITFIYFIINICTIYFKQDLLLINISSYFGDTYVNSIDRFYGTLNYPNATALLGILGFISSIYLLNKDEKNTYLHIICSFISMLIYQYAFSKMITIDLIITILIYIIYLIINKKKEHIYNIINLLISLTIPTLISITLFRNYLINHNILSLIINLILLIISIIIFYKILTKTNKYIKTIIIIILVVVLSIFTLKKYNKPLEINNVEEINNYYLIDFYLEKNKEYDIKINYEKDNSGVKFYLVEYYVENLYPVSKKIKEIKDNIHFETDNKFEYYMIYAENINPKTNIKIDYISINNQKYYLNYKLMPYQIIHQLELTKYDKESVTHRMWYYKDSLKYISQNKYIFGRGINSFKYLSKDNGKYLEDTTHSYILQLWIDYGIIGLIFYIFIIIFGISNIILYRKNEDNIIYSLLFISLMMFSMFDGNFDRTIFRFLMYILLFTIANYKNEKNNNVMFISSAGGHFTELIKMKKIFKDYNYVIITEKNNISLKYKEKYNINYLMYGARYYPLKYPFVCIVNIFKSIYYFFKYNPSVIVATGAHSCVLMAYLGFIFGKKIIYLEVFDRIDNPTVTGYLLYPISTIFYVQHKEMIKKFKKAKYIEGIY